MSVTAGHAVGLILLAMVGLFTTVVLIGVFVMMFQEGGWLCLGMMLFVFALCAGAWLVSTTDSSADKPIYQCECMYCYHETGKESP